MSLEGLTLQKPDNISIALTSGVAKDNQNGSTSQKSPGVTVGASTLNTNYSRLSLALQVNKAILNGLKLV